MSEYEKRVLNEIEQLSISQALLIRALRTGKDELELLGELPLNERNVAE